MIDSDRFVKDVYAIVGRDIASNMEQLAIVMSPPERSLKVVAGPGSGKTTVIVLRLLKMVLVDDIAPESIMATTFTRKAAKELKSRILKWGHLLQYHYSEDQSIDKAVRDRIRRLNFDLIKTGTLDSIAEDALTVYRQPNENPPMMITEFVSKQIMLSSLFDYFKTKDGIKSELSGIGITPYNIRSTSGLVKMLLDIYNRSVENMIGTLELQVAQIAGEEAKLLSSMSSSSGQEMELPVYTFDFFALQVGGNQVGAFNPAPGFTSGDYPIPPYTMTKSGAVGAGKTLPTYFAAPRAVKTGYPVCLLSSDVRAMTVAK